MLKETIRKILEETAPGDISIQITVPEQGSFGHYATNLPLLLAKQSGKDALAVARDLAQRVVKKAPPGFFEKTEAVAPGFLNFWISTQAHREALRAFLGMKAFGIGDIGKGKTIIVEYSQPNIAKPMHVGHLRSTIIGDALANIHEFLGYKVIRWNYLGDWGTQFGKLIAAYKLWGKKEEVEEDPIPTLLALYVRFHGEEKKDRELERRGQEEFRKLEGGDAENRKLWEWFREESLKEFERTYARLGVRFDTYRGESAYEAELPTLMKKLEDQGIAVRSEGALVIPLGEAKTPALIQKSDGASLYLTRDIANLAYRMEKYRPAKILYVVGNEQSLHFAQLFHVAARIKLQGPELVHVKFGLVLGEDHRKLATREGTTIPLEKLLEKAVSLAKKIVEEKNPDLPEKEKEEIAESVGIGAVKFNDLKEHRNSDVAFDWEKMLSVRGMSAPYLQYSYARIRSIERKAGEIGAADIAELGSDEELAIARYLFELPEVLARAAETYTTNGLAEYLFKLANRVNGYYESTPIIKDENVKRKNARLLLLHAAAAVLSKGLGLLGIKAPERM